MNRHEPSFLSRTYDARYVPATIAVERIGRDPSMYIHHNKERSPDQTVRSIDSLVATSETGTSQSPSMSISEPLQRDNSLLYFPTIKWSDDNLGRFTGPARRNNNNTNFDCIRRGKQTRNSSNKNLNINKRSTFLACKKNHQWRRKKHLLRSMSVQNRLNELARDSVFQDQNKHCEQLYHESFALIPIFLEPASAKDDSNVNSHESIPYNVVG